MRAFYRDGLGNHQQSFQVRYLGDLFYNWRLQVDRRIKAARSVANA